MSGAAAGGPRVAVIEPVGGHGGMHFYDAGLCGGLGRAGVRPVLHTCERRPPPSEPGVFEVRTTFTGVYGADPAWRRGLRFLRGLVAALAGERLRGARLVHFHFFHVGALEFAGVAIARALGLRVVITAHDVEAFEAAVEVPALARRTYALAQAVIAHNRSSAREVHERLGVAAARIHVVPHGSYLDVVGALPPRDEARRRLGLDPDAGPVLLFFGQIKAVKGLDVLIDATARLAQRLPGLRLVIAGRVWKDDFSRYAAQIERGGLGGRVVAHVRYIPDDEVAGYYGAADLVVLPYRRIYQSGVLLLAMSQGTPVVVSDLEPMREVVRDGDNGFVFADGDAADLARTIERALADPQRLEAVRERARAEMRERFDWGAIGRQTAAAYDAALR